MNTATFYHAGCPVCVSAEEKITDIIDTKRYKLEIVHLGDTPSRIAEAERTGVVSVPALVLGDTPLHINHGADLSALKN